MILFRYLFKHIFASLLAVTFTLMLIVVSGRFVKYLAEAAAGDLDPEVLFSVILFRLPSFLELILPLSLFIAILLSYGRLYAESEMTVMTACGVSTRRLSLYTLVPSLIVALLVGWLSLEVSPSGIDSVQKIFADNRASTGMQALVEGRFRVAKDSGRVSYVERLDRESGEMRTVFFADRSPRAGMGTEVSIVLAQSGHNEYSEESDGRFLVLEEGARYLGQAGRADYRITRFSEFGQRLEEKESTYFQKSDARSTADLLSSTKPKDQATLQWRLSLPLLVPIIALMAQGLSRTDPRRGRYAKLLPAFLLFMSYLVLLNVAREAVGKQKLPESIGLWWVHGLFFVIALLTLCGGYLRRSWRRATVRSQHA